MEETVTSYTLFNPNPVKLRILSDFENINNFDLFPGQVVEFHNVIPEGLKLYQKPMIYKGYPALMIGLIDKDF